MTNNFPAMNLYEEDTSDSLSTGVHSLNSFSLEGTPFNPLFMEPCETDNLSSQTKKIGKKRNAYHKVDDDIRLKLLDAVQVNGETLKSAAKRLGVNYSSAKSVIHTFRKEGRILKKSALERTTNYYQLPLGEIDINTMNNFSPFSIDSFGSKSTNLTEYPRPSDFYQGALNNSYQSENRPSSPMRGLTDNFGHLLLNNNANANHINNQSHNEELVIPKLILPEVSHKPQPTIPIEDMIPNLSQPSFQNNASTLSIPVFNLTKGQSPANNPLDSLKHLENFYMNYSNSPLSGGNGNMFKECSDSSSRRMCQKEFDSFSELVNAFQSQPRMIDETKKNIHIPRPLRRNDSAFSQDKGEMRNMGEENAGWNVGIETSPMGTFKNLMGAQFILCDALKKASLLNNLVQFQMNGTGESPTSNKNKQG